MRFLIALLCVAAGLIDCMADEGRTSGIGRQAQLAEKGMS
jgi:hypothetical protein